MFQNTVSLKRGTVSMKQYETKIFKSLSPRRHEGHEIFSFFSALRVRQLLPASPKAPTFRSVRLEFHYSHISKVTVIPAWMPE